MTGKVHATNRAKIAPIKIDAVKLQEVSKKTGLSMEFLKSVINAEGFQTKQYKIAGVNTIGIGHNMDSDPKFKEKKGLKISESQVYGLFIKDLLDAEEKANRYTKGEFYSLNQGQKETVLDISFNVKPTTFQKSPFVMAISAGRHEDAVKEIDYVAASGKILPGLCNRSIENIGRYARGQHPDKAKMAINNIIEKCGARSDVMNVGQKAMDKLEMAWVFKEKDTNQLFTGTNR